MLCVFTIVPAAVYFEVCVKDKEKTLLLWRCGVFDKIGKHFRLYMATNPTLTQWEEEGVEEEPSNVNFLNRVKFCIIKTF
jgi:hypothetical protein